MSMQTISATGQSPRHRRRFPEATDYLGKGRVAACCARLRYNIRPDAGEMNERFNHAASGYWHYLAGVSQRPITWALNLAAIYNGTLIIRLAAQGHTNQSIATPLGTTEGTVKNRRQRIRRWLTALAEQNNVAGMVEEWTKSGGNHHRVNVIKGAYSNGRKPGVSHAG